MKFIVFYFISRLCLINIIRTVNKHFTLIVSIIIRLLSHHLFISLHEVIMLLRLQYVPTHISNEHDTIIQKKSCPCMPLGRTRYNSTLNAICIRLFHMSNQVGIQNTFYESNTLSLNVNSLL